nr:O-antigen ligase family protein [Ancylobacter oerskovii]
MAGAGDVLFPLRTAGYALLTETEHAGFWRVAGLHPEASAFGAAALAGLAFSFTYWRASRSRSALALTILLLSLTLLSTSSTAYGGLVVLMLAALLAAARSLLRGRPLRTDAIWLGAALVAATVVLAMLLVDDEAFAKVETLLRATIFEKSTSASGVERAYWNQRSLDSFFTTSMLGIGLGSSRSSSWVIAVLSQLGLIGSVLLGLLVGLIAWPGRRRAWGDPPVGSQARRVIALHDGVRAAALTLLLAATIGGGSADPGVLFFISLATVLGCRHYLDRYARPSPVRRPVRSPWPHPEGQPA